MAIEKHILSKNRLQYETSPYLLQHAENPVDWYPWGEEAFRKAATENKPILLSIGYSSCHWCHVMARESFSDPQVAALMNRVFVNIKVDREERPDIDQFYMLVCQMMTGRGGWPLTVIMTPDKKPVFAATYLPPHTRGNMLGMAEMALKLEELWRLERRKVVDSSEQIADSLELAMTAARGEPLPLDKDLEERAFKELEQSYDDKNGGFGTAPKFPSIHTLLFILLYWRRHQDASARQIVEHTLFRMAGGGIFDQIGFGFHRYSTDAHWILPHFEKMLYDQAMFALIYADAFSAFGKKEYAATAEKTIAYVLQTLTSVEGAFFSAQDADSEGEEGKYYVWTAEEVKKVLGTEAGRFALELFSMTDAGNFADESTGRRNGANIALRRKELEAIAGDFDLRPDQAAIKAEEVRSRLAEARRQRFAPRIDDKILVDWNGLMIGALARAGRILGNRVYTEAAAKAADFLWQSCRADAALFHCYCKGKLSGVGFLSDYAFLSWGLFELYQSTFEARHLKHAKLLLDEMLQRFWDKNKGDFFYSDPGERDLPMPTKESADGAIPSGTSIALYLLNRFATLSGEERYAEHARQLSASLGSSASHLPQAYLATLYFHGISDENSAQLVLCGSRGAIDGSPLMAYLRSAYHPDLAVYLEGDTARSPLTSLLPGLSSCGTTANGKLTAYLCRNRQCLPPVANPEELWRQLQH